MKRILIVDDEPHVIRVMRMALERNGYTVDEAGNGEMALQRITENTPDVMITDIDMPRMNGEALCKEVQRTMPGRTFRIYVLTARAELEHRIWSSSIANLEFLEKPVSIRKLAAQLQTYFSASDENKEQEQCLSTP
ncbi:MAG: response regulator [Gammaproteobacteria bacterium]